MLVQTLKNLCTYSAFREIQQLDPKPFKQSLDQALFELTELGLRMFPHEKAYSICFHIGSNFYEIT